MTDEQPDLSAELSRAEEAATGGIEVRAFLLEIDDDDEQMLDDGDDGTAIDGDDDDVEDDDPTPVDV
jgi:hypothetical protein